MLENLQYFYMTELTEAILVQNFTCCTLFTAITVNDWLPNSSSYPSRLMQRWVLFLPLTDKCRMCKKNFKTHQQCMSECYWIM